MCVRALPKETVRKKEERRHTPPPVLPSTTPLTHFPYHSPLFCLFNVRVFISMKGGMLGPRVGPSQSRALLIFWAKVGMGF